MPVVYMLAVVGGLALGFLCLHGLLDLTERF